MEVNKNEILRMYELCENFSQNKADIENILYNILAPSAVKYGKSNSVLIMRVDHCIQMVDSFNELLSISDCVPNVINNYSCNGEEDKLALKNISFSLLIHDLCKFENDNDIEHGKRCVCILDTIHEINLPYYCLFAIANHSEKDIKYYDDMYKFANIIKDLDILTKAVPERLNAYKEAVINGEVAGLKKLCKKTIDYRFKNKKLRKIFLERYADHVYELLEECEKHNIK